MLPSPPTVETPDWPAIIQELEAKRSVAYAFSFEQANVLRVAAYRRGWKASMHAVREGASVIGYELRITGLRRLEGSSVQPSP